MAALTCGMNSSPPSSWALLVKNPSCLLTLHHRVQTANSILGGCGASETAAIVGSMERNAAVRAAHRRSIEAMIRRVLQMRAIQAQSDIVATAPSRLDQLEAHLRYFRAPMQHPFQSMLPLTPSHRVEATDPSRLDQLEAHLRSPPLTPPPPPFSLLTAFHHTPFTWIVALLTGLTQLSGSVGGTTQGSPRRALLSMFTWLRICDCLARFPWSSLQLE